MKFIIMAMLVLVHLTTAGCRVQDDSDSAKEQNPKPPGISLIVAALQGNIDVTRQHIEAGSDLDEKDAYGSTPLIVAVTFGRTDVAKALLAAGADLEIKNNDGSTPLHIAAFFCHEEIVKALLDNGADKNARNNAGRTALESVTAPFDEVKGIYDRVGKALKPLGLKLDYDRIRQMRPRIAEMLRKT